MFRGPAAVAEKLPPSIIGTVESREALLALYVSDVLLCAVCGTVDTVLLSKHAADWSRMSVGLCWTSRGCSLVTEALWARLDSCAASTARICEGLLQCTAMASSDGQLQANFCSVDAPAGA